MIMINDRSSIEFCFLVKESRRPSTQEDFTINFIQTRFNLSWISKFSNHGHHDQDDQYHDLWSWSHPGVIWVRDDPLVSRGPAGHFLKMIITLYIVLVSYWLSRQNKIRWFAFYLSDLYFRHLGSECHYWKRCLLTFKSFHWWSLSFHQFRLLATTPSSSPLAAPLFRWALHFNHNFGPCQYFGPCHSGPCH